MHILVVEDEPRVGSFVERVLQEQTSGDAVPGLVNSAGFGKWTYVADVGVR